MTSPPTRPVTDQLARLATLGSAPTAQPGSTTPSEIGLVPHSPPATQPPAAAQSRRVAPPVPRDQLSGPTNPLALPSSSLPPSACVALATAAAAPAPPADIAPGPALVALEPAAACVLCGMPRSIRPDVSLPSRGARTPSGIPGTAGASSSPPSVDAPPHVSRLLPSPRRLAPRHPGHFSRALRPGGSILPSIRGSILESVEVDWATGSTASWLHRRHAVSEDPRSRACQATTSDHARGIGKA